MLTLSQAAVAPCILSPVGEMSGMRLERFIRARWDREQGGMRALAEQAGLSSDAFYKWFRGDAEPSLEAFGRLARVLGVKRYELVAVYDGDQPAVDLGSVMDPTLRSQLLDLIADEVDRRMAAEVEAGEWARSDESDSQLPDARRESRSE